METRSAANRRTSSPRPQANSVRTWSWSASKKHFINRRKSRSGRADKDRNGIDARVKSAQANAENNKQSDENAV